ncbi:MAG: hypothetical protein MZV63_14780 [Marinilabiliales bacterium]|nr:hypothetical protein [Marinilabiliales bacterium]
MHEILTGYYLKLSGESLSGNGNHGISDDVLEEYAGQIVEVVREGCEVAIVIGGGNIFRGLSGTESGFDRVKGDQMGMLATVINSLALESAIIRLGGKAKVFTSIRMEPVGELYNRDKVVEATEEQEQSASFQEEQGIHSSQPILPLH